MTAKIVYYGPGLCGKTTNLSAIYERTSQKARGEMVSLNTETDRTLFFDLLPMEVGVIGGFKAKLQLYTVPGQVFYNSTRKLVLKGVDGIVFVADSQTAMLDANRESIQNLTENLRELGLKIGDIPMIFQWNKRDLKQIVPVEVLERELNPRHLTSFQAIARSGEGVFETLRGISRLALAQIKTQHLGDGPSAQEAETPAPRPVVAAPPPPPPPTQPLPAWSMPTPPVPPDPPAGTGFPVAGPDTHSDADTHPGADTHPDSALPEALSFLDLSSGVDGTSPGTLPEALSFLDLSSSLDLFQTTREDVPEPPQPDPPAPAEPPRPADGQVKIMAPRVVKLLPPQPPQPSRPAGTSSQGSGTVPRVALRAPVPPIPLRGLLQMHPWPSAPAARHSQVLQVSLPPDSDGGELEVRVQVRRKGLLIAESATAIAGPGPDGPGTLAIEFKRS
jgi:signal recognition particle receptor subunit beta